MLTEEAAPELRNLLRFAMHSPCATPPGTIAAPSDGNHTRLHVHFAAHPGVQENGPAVKAR